MPELPEVESVLRSIRPIVLGRTIARVDVLTAGVFLNDHLPAEGWRIAAMSRRGKYLVMELDRDETDEPARARLVIHLRMTGQLLLDRKEPVPQKHTHVIMRLDSPEDGELPIWLEYHDTRRFGRLCLLPADGRGEPAGLAALGPEPLEPGFDLDLFACKLARRTKSSLKAVLLDQTVLAGLGNIYADEVLFASGLNPARTAGSLNRSEMARLREATVRVLTRAIDCQGTTLRDYVNGWNQQGTFQNCLMVYGRAGRPCQICSTPIQARRLAGRTTCWCPLCQPDELPQAIQVQTTKTARCRQNGST